MRKGRLRILSLLQKLLEMLNRNFLCKIIILNRIDTQFSKAFFVRFFITYIKIRNLLTKSTNKFVEDISSNKLFFCKITTSVIYGS